MRKETVMSGITVLAALVLMGAGCAGSGTGSVQTPPAGGTGASEKIYLNDGTSPGSGLPSGAPVTGYESGLSDPSQK